MSEAAAAPEVMIEQVLAEWAAGRHRFSSQSRQLAQDALVDITACIIGGSTDPATQAVARVSRQLGTGTAMAMGSDLRLTAPWAALVTGTAAHALDFDDNFAPATTHASAVLGPALFALADEEQLTGAAVIEAYIVGLELQARIGHLVNPRHYERGWHATSTVGAIGTAGGCARLLGLDAQQIHAAMSIAFSMASGSKKQFGSMMKPIHAGLAAKNAVLAARMAQAGIAGNPEVFCGRWGFADLYGAADGEDGLPTQVLDNLGRTLSIETDGLLTKRFPCCGAAHRTLDGLAALREQQPFLLEDVAEVQAFIPNFARANLRFDHPRTVDEARFSLTYCAARVLQTGELRLHDMTPEKVSDAAIRPVIDRIIIKSMPGSVTEELGQNAKPSVTRVIFKNGAVREIGISAPKGSKQAPLSEREKRDKFYDCCRWAGRENDSEQLLEIARSLREVECFTDFSGKFARSPDGWRRCDADDPPSS